MMSGEEKKFLEEEVETLGKRGVLNAQNNAASGRNVAQAWTAQRRSSFVKKRRPRSVALGGRVTNQTMSKNLEVAFKGGMN